MILLVIGEGKDAREKTIPLVTKANPSAGIRQISDASELDAALEGGDFDAVVTGYKLPFANGLDVLRQIKSRYPGVPVIMFTGEGSEEVAAQAMKEGLYDYVPAKHAERLPAALKEALDTAALSRARIDRAGRLRLPEERYRDIAELMADYAYSFRVEPDGRNALEWLTPSFERITGYSAETLPEGADLYNLVHPDDVPRLIERVRRLRDGLPDLSEFRLITKDGGHVWVRDHVRPRWDAEGRVVGFLGAGQDITRRKDAEQGQSRLTAIVEATTEFVGSADASGKLLYINGAGRRLVGLSENEDVRDFHISRFVAPSSMHTVMDVALPTAIREGTWSGETLLLTSDGREVPVLQILIAHKSPSGDVEYISTIAHDITRLKQDEQALQENEERYRQMFERNQAVKLLIDPVTGDIVDANPAASEFYGYPLDTLKGMKIWQINTLSQREVEAEMAHARAEKRMYFVFKHRLASGELRDVEVHSGPINVMDRRLLYSIVHDITQRKRAEDALAAEKDLLDVTLRSIGDGVITTDTSGRIVLMNTVAETLTGWKQEDAAGRPLDEVFRLVDDRTRGAHEGPTGSVLRTGEGGELPTNAVLVARDGTERVLAGSARPSADTEGAALGVVIAFRDITDRQRIEEELLKANKLESVGLLAGGIAHDFNNFLASILGNISLARRSAEREGRPAKELAEAEKACLQARDLTNQLLTFARGGAPIKKTMSVEELVHDTVNFVLRGSRVRSHITCSPGLWPAEIDEGQISRVLNNLVINAQQAMVDGGTIEITCENLVVGPRDKKLHDASIRPGEYVRIAVRDQGPGISKQNLARIFDPYFTTKDRGSGLGLTISYSIVKNHDGYLTCESRPGAGTTFYVYLPASHALVQPGEPARLLRRAHGARILVMDDQEAIRDLIGAILQDSGYSPSLAADGHEAITTYEQAMREGMPFDLVMMDLTVPGGMGGKETIKRLLAIDPSVKAIVLSGYSNDPIMADYETFGFSGVVPKPFELDELVSAIQSVLTGVGPSSARPEATESMLPGS